MPRTENDRPFGFGGLLSSEFPSQIIFDVSELCSLACIHCPHPAFKKSDHFAARQLPLSLHNKMIDEIASDGRGHCRYVRYTGLGEPFLNKDFLAMLRYSGETVGIPVNVTSNGQHFDEENVTALIQAGVAVVDVSIDAATPRTYAQVRVNGDLQETTRNVMRLMEAIHDHNSAMRVVVSFVEQAENSHEVSAFSDFWTAAGAHRVVIRRLHSAAGAAAKALRQLDRPEGEERYPCLYPWERLSLSPRGDLQFCPQDWVHGSVLADFRETSVREVWRGAAMLELRRAHLRNNFESHAFCGRCRDWRTTRWPSQGRSYADMMSELTDGRASFEPGHSER